MYSGLGRRRGRHEPNKPRVSLEAFNEKLSNVIIEFIRDTLQAKSVPEVPDINFNSSDCWALYKKLLLLAPAFVISSGLPLSIYAFGSFKLIESKNGKEKLKFKVSPSINKYINNISWIKFGDSSMDVLEELLQIGKSVDMSLENASNES